MLVRRTRNTGRQGGALVAALLAVTAIAGLGASLLQMQAAVLRRHSQAIDSKRALYLAEAGLAEAFFAIAQGKSGNVGSAAMPARFGAGVYWVEASWRGHDQVELASTGLCGAGRFAVARMVRRPENALAALGLAGAQEVVVGGGSVLDAYDSREGPWEEPEGGPPEEPTGLTLRSGGDVAVLDGGSEQGPTRVLGDVLAGGAIDLDPRVEVSGATLTVPGGLALPPLEPPAVPLDGSLTVKDGKRRTLADEVRGLERVRVRRDSTLDLEGPLTLVVRELTVDREAQLAIDASEGPVSIYVLDRLALAERSILETAGGSSADVGLFFLGGDDPDAFTFAPEGEFGGLLYAPAAHLVVPEGLRLFGSVAARVLEFADGTEATFDRATLTSPLAGRGLPTSVSWWIRPLPDEEIVRRRMDPLALLALRGVTPAPSAQAHLEEELELTYLDTGGALRRFFGLSQDLDWSTVREVLQVWWTDSPAPVGPGGGGPLLAAIGDRTLDSSALKGDLLAATPVSNGVMIAAMRRDPAMGSSDLKAVLVANGPLGVGVLNQLTKGYAPLSSSDLKQVLLDNSPLPTGVLASVSELPANLLSASDRAAVQAAN